jgi:DNA repair photolyase
MQVIYEPSGRALEYGLLALNLYVGCAHQCTYCYVPGALRMTRAQWAALEPHPRASILRELRKQAPQFRGTDRRVLLCFSTDPYQPIAQTTGVTRAALEILHDNEIPFQVLTKGGLLAAPDFGLYGPDDAFAVTLTSVDANIAWAAEPHAASPVNRIAALEQAKRLGIETWVSLEPVLDPQQSLEVIRQTHDVVDLYKIGKLNHDHPAESRIDWLRFAYQAVNLCEKFDTPYYLKKDLADYCDFAYRNTDNRRAGWRTL